MAQAAAVVENDQMVTIRDVARQAGVSPSLVSAVISGKSSTVRMSESTRQRVAQAVKASGYRINHAARSLTKARSGLIAAVVPKIANPVFEQAIRGMHLQAERQGEVLLLADSLWIEPGSHLMSRMAGTGLVDGFLLRSAEWGTETMAELTSRSIPFVILQTPGADGPTSVWVDDSAGIELATHHLLELGHRRIALVGGPTSAHLADQRLLGYRRALAAYGVRANSRLVRQVGYDPGLLYGATTTLLKQRAAPTALVVDNIIAAPGALASVLDADLAVPDELSVVVYHDLPIADQLRPVPTTVAMPVQQAGELGYQLLSSMINHPESDPQSQVVTGPAPRLIDRGSTGPASR